MKNIILLLFLISTSTSFCQTNKVKETTENDSYLKEIPFNFKYGIPIIEVNINNEKYNFLFDTGMTTAISTKLANKLNLSNSRETKGYDINGNSSKEKYVNLHEISVGGIIFGETEALVANLGNSFEFKCLNIDGVFGNNLIKDAIWQIDYQNKIISFTNDIKKLNITKDTKTINFTTKEGYYSPDVTISLDGLEIEKVKFDTGSDSNINVNLDSYSKKKHSKNSIEFIGTSGVSLYGRGKKNKTITSKIKNIKLGTLTINSQLVSFSKKYPLIGNHFLKNYLVTINYNDNLIYLTKLENKDLLELRSFGFKSAITNNKIIVTGVFKKSTAEKKGLTIGDEIISLNTAAVQEILNSDNSCEIMYKTFQKNDTINLTILKKGKKQKMALTKEILIQ